jgi:hypothetical protein
MALEIAVITEGGLIKLPFLGKVSMFHTWQRGVEREALKRCQDLALLIRGVSSVE